MKNRNKGFQENKGCYLALIIPAAILLLISVIILLANNFSDGAWITFSILMIYPFIVFILLIIFGIGSFASKKVIDTSNEADIRLQRKRVIITSLVAIPAIIIIFITTGAWRYGWLFYAAIFLIFPYVGSLYRLKDKNARPFIITLAVLISFVTVLFLGDMSDPDTVTIINGIRSTDFSENIAAKLGIFGASALLLYGEEAYLSRVIYWLCAPKKRK